MFGGSGPRGPLASGSVVCQQVDRRVRLFLGSRSPWAIQNRPEWSVLAVAGSESVSTRRNLRGPSWARTSAATACRRPAEHRFRRKDETSLGYRGMAEDLLSSGRKAKCLTTLTRKNHNAVGCSDPILPDSESGKPINLTSLSSAGIRTKYESRYDCHRVPTPSAITRSILPNLLITPDSISLFLSQAC